MRTLLGVNDGQDPVTAGMSEFKDPDAIAEAKRLKKQILNAGEQVIPAIANSSPEAVAKVLREDDEVPTRKRHSKTHPTEIAE